MRIEPVQASHGSVQAIQHPARVIQYWALPRRPLPGDGWPLRWSLGVERKSRGGGVTWYPTSLPCAPRPMVSVHSRSVWSEGPLVALRMCGGGHGLAAGTSIGQRDPGLSWHSSIHRLRRVFEVASRPLPLVRHRVRKGFLRPPARHFRFSGASPLPSGAGHIRPGPLQTRKRESFAYRDVDRPGPAR